MRQETWSILVLTDMPKMCMFTVTNEFFQTLWNIIPVTHVRGGVEHPIQLPKIPLLLFLDNSTLVKQ